MARYSKRMISRVAIGMSVAIALGGNVAMATEAEAAPGPGLCFEAITSSIDVAAWSDVLGAFEAAVDENPDFFSDANVVSIPDLRSAWEPQSFETVKIGVWSASPDEARSTEQLRDALAAHQCRASESIWEARVSRDLLFAAAELILARARVPDESGEPPIPADATTEIIVDFYPEEARIRTMLKFNVPVMFLNPGGECWIDDVLVPGGEGVPPTSIATGGQQTDPLVGSACDLFRAFMSDGGLGERALSLLPAKVTLSDGTTIALEASVVEVAVDTLILGGTIER